MVALTEEEWALYSTLKKQSHAIKITKPCWAKHAIIQYCKDNFPESEWESQITKLFEAWKNGSKFDPSILLDNDDYAKNISLPDLTIRRQKNLMNKGEEVETILKKVRLTHDEFNKLPPIKKLQFEIIEKWVPTEVLYTSHQPLSPEIKDAHWEPMYVLRGGPEVDKIKAENKAAEATKEGGYKRSKKTRGRKNKKRTIRRR